VNTSSGQTAPNWRRLAANDSGVTAVLTGLALTVLMGFAGLAVDAAYWQLNQRNMQGAADQAAFAAAHVADAGATAAVATTTAKGVAAQFGFVDGQGNVTVTVNHPPAQSACCNGVGTDWEVVIRQTQPMWLSGVLLNTAPVAVGRAVANQSGAPGGIACVIALDTGAANALHLNNNASLPSTTCGAASNSSSADALTLSNNASIAGPVNVVGQYSLANNATLSNSSVVENGAAVTDPYAGLSYPASFGSCTGQAHSAGNNGTLNLTPGHFCSGWSTGNNATVNLAAGTYYVDGGISLGNNATVTGSGGVTIVISDNSAVDIGNNATLTLTAPNASSGQPFPGIAIMSLSTSTSVTQTFENNTTLDITGAVYFRNQTLSFKNNGMTGTTGCTQLIARIINLSNNVRLDTSCSGVGTTTAYMNANPKLVE
jgi:Flp pilus assembly protein TadG